MGYSVRLSFFFFSPWFYGLLYFMHLICFCPWCILPVYSGDTPLPFNIFLLLIKKKKNTLENVFRINFRVPTKNRKNKSFFVSQEIIFCWNKWRVSWLSFSDYICFLIYCTICICYYFVKVHVSIVSSDSSFLLCLGKLQFSSSDFYGKIHC